MVSKFQSAVLVCVMTYIALWSSSYGTLMPNLTEKCFRCLCYVHTKCDLRHGCTGGYCGPFNISKVYWADAGKVLPPTEESDRTYGWKDCAMDYHCAKIIVGAYLQKFEKDCNNDGVIDCYDYMMLNANGGYQCSAPLNRSVNGRIWLSRYEDCRL